MLLGSFIFSFLLFIFVFSGFFGFFWLFLVIFGYFRLFSVGFVVFRFNRNTETRGFDIEPKQPKETFCFE